MLKSLVGCFLLAEIFFYLELLLFLSEEYELFDLFVRLLSLLYFFFLLLFNDFLLLFKKLRTSGKE